jgi:hypothetical protein
MFDRLKKALQRDARTAPADERASADFQAPVSQWASQEGFAVSMHGGDTVVLDGKVGGKPWRMELGKPTRNYIRGEELRARAELGLSDEISVMVMNRPLKEALERKAYSMITDTLQTTADPHLPEEMRWLAMYSEVGWDSIPQAFWDRYAVLADRREHALAWIDPEFAQKLLDWPKPAPSREVPFLLIVMRGKAYLRMEYSPAEIATLQYAAQVFTSACEAAVGGFSTHVDLE